MKHLLLLTCALSCFFALTAPAQEHRSQASSSGAVEERIRRIENGFPAITLKAGGKPVQMDLRKIMEVSNVPGLSVAVIDDYKIAWARGYGFTAPGGHVAVTTHTRFPACSISKPVTTLAALRLVEQGKLSIDDDVNLKLRSWKVPENEFTQQEKVTLRRILTHTAGTTVHGYPGYPAGQPAPTLLQVLNGTAPAETQPVRVNFVPGSKQRYSGGGFAILQQLMIDVTGKPFPQIMQELVFSPLDLKDSTFEQPTPSVGVAATGTNRTGNAILAMTSPELAAGGLWTTPSDLARIAIEVALEKDGKSHRVLSPATASQMLKLQVDLKIENVEGGPAMRMGLGWKLGDESDLGRFEHDGVNIGYSAELMMWNSGHGVVVMWNNWSFESQLVVRYLVNNIAKEYGWSYRVTPYTPALYADTEVLAVARLAGAQAAIAKYYELKKRWTAGKDERPPGVVWASDPPDFPPNQWDLFGVANTIADPQHLRDAITIMKVEVNEYPQFAPAQKRLAELYVQAGKNKLAAASYQAYLKLEPDDKEAREAVEKMREGNHH